MALTACLLVGQIACGPRVSPQGPGETPGEVTHPRPRGTLAAPARQVLLGEMCPEAAAGRPSVLPMFLRGIGWRIAPDEVADPVARNQVRQFTVLAWDGGRAGVFSVAAAAEVGLERRVAVGGYAGRSPCLPGGEAAEPDPACVVAQRHCGLAVGLLEPVGGLEARPLEEHGPPLEVATGGACVSEDLLMVDIDGDGVAEAFPLARFLDPVRAPAEEISAAGPGAAACEPRFAVRAALPAGDPRHFRGMDVLGVVDLDGNGRFELIVAFDYADRRTWAVYSATSNAGRLELMGEVVPWPRGE
jgi:hypothetical protein